MAPSITTGSSARKWVGYARVSTDEQAQHGVSLDAQKAKLAAWAQLNGAELVAVIVEPDGVSGTVPLAARPGGRQVLDLLTSGKAGGVVFAKLDRVFRSTADCVTTVDELFRPNDWELASLAEQLDTSSSMGRFLLRTFASLAELERDRIAERTSDALRHLQASGVRLGAEGFGWRYGERNADGYRVAVPVPDEARAVKLVRKLRERGETLRGIAEQLTHAGIPTKRGGRWHAKVVRTILLSADCVQPTNRASCCA